MKMINLLPPLEQDLLRKEKLLHSLGRAMAISFLSYVMAVFILIGGRIYLQTSLSGLDSRIAEQNRIISGQNNAELKKQVDKYNFAANDYKTLQAVVPRWSKFITAFASLVPEDIQITSFNVNSASGKISITGKSKTRDSVLVLRSNIVSSRYFKNIDLPLENLKKPRDLDFTYTFYLDADILTKDEGAN